MSRRLPTAAFVLFVVTQTSVVQGFDPFAGEDSLASSEPKIEAAANGLIYSRWNSDLRNDGGGEQLHEWRNKALLSVDMRHERGWTIHMSGFARYELYPQPQGLQADFEPELWEGYIKWSKSTWELVAGQHIRRWGRGVPSLADVVVPGDFSEFLFVEDEFQKRPLPMARWTKYGASYELEVIAIPFFRGAKLPGNDSDWSPIVIDDLDGAEDIPLVEGALDAGIEPGDVTRPEDNFLHGDLGLRWTKYLDGMDLDVYLFYGYEDLPAPRFSEGFVDFLAAEAARGRSALTTLRSLALQEIVAFSPIYSQRPRRQFMGAASLVKPLQAVTARFEVSGFDRQSVYTEALDLVRVPSVQGLIGIDALSGERFLWSLSLIGNVLITDEDLFLIERYNAIATGVMRVRPGERPLWLELRALWNVNLGDAWLGPSVIYDLATGWQLQAGVQALLGTPTSPIGQFDDNDYVWLRLRYAF